MILNSEGMPCALLRLSSDGRIRFSNQVFAQWMEVSDAIVPGRMIDDYLARPSRIYFHTHVLTHLHLHGMVEEIYLSLQKFSEGELHVIFNAVRHVDADGEYLDCILVRMLRRADYTQEIKRLRLELQEASEALKSANAALRAYRGEER